MAVWYRCCKSLSRSGANPEGGINRASSARTLDCLCSRWIGSKSELPFETGGWRDEGIPSALVVRFCERQTEQDNPTTCATIFHNGRKIYEYNPPEATDQSAHVVFAAQESHCFFYRKGTQLASKSKVRSSGTSTTYSCHKVRETFEPERGQPWRDWLPYYELQPLMAEGFRSLRRPKRRYNDTETRIEREALYFYTKGDDFDAIYEECLGHQKDLHGSSCVSGSNGLMATTRRR